MMTINLNLYQEKPTEWLNFNEPVLHISTFVLIRLSVYVSVLNDFYSINKITNLWN